MKYFLVLVYIFLILSACSTSKSNQTKDISYIDYSLSRKNQLAEAFRKNETDGSLKIFNEYRKDILSRLDLADFHSDTLIIYESTNKSGINIEEDWSYSISIFKSINKEYLTYTNEDAEPRKKISYDKDNISSSRIETEYLKKTSVSEDFIKLISIICKGNTASLAEKKKRRYFIPEVRISNFLIVAIKQGEKYNIDTYRDISYPSHYFVEPYSIGVGSLEVDNAEK